MAKKIVVESYDIQPVIRAFSKHYGTKTGDENIEYRTQIPASHGEGLVLGLDFKDGLSIMIFNGVLNEELSLRFAVTKAQPLRFIFCLEGGLKHSIRQDQIAYELSSLASSVVCGSVKSEQIMLLPAHIPLYFCCIDMDRRKYQPKMGLSLTNMQPEIKEILQDVRGKRSFLYQCNYGLATAQCIQNIKLNDYKALVRRVYIESQCLEIIAMQIKQWMDDTAPGRKQPVLRKRDMELIMEARKRLLQDLMEPPTIKELAHMMGTNENKLKAGFRLLYNTSINKLLQDERLSRAKMLMAEESYPIREIAKMVGYHHPAHFASKFKKRFGMLPKEYIKSMLT